MLPEYQFLGCLIVCVILGAIALVVSFILKESFLDSLLIVGGTIGFLLVLAMIFAQFVRLYEFLKRVFWTGILRKGYRFERFTSAILNEEQETILTMLEESPKLIHFKDSEGRTVLHNSVNNLPKHIFSLLIGRGADVNARDKDGSRPLHYALARTDDRIAEIVHYLISKGADANATDNRGRTPLHDAVMDAVRFSEKGSARVIEMLIKMGADIHVKDNDGMTPLQFAEEGENIQIAELLRKYGTK